MPAKKVLLATRLLRSASKAVAISKGLMKPSRTFTVPMTTRNAPHIPDAPEFTSKKRCWHSREDGRIAASLREVWRFSGREYKWNVLTSANVI